MKKYRKNYTFDKATIEVLEGFNNHSEVLRLLVASLNPLSNREGIKERLMKLKK
jgi:hypothetical protein